MECCGLSSTGLNDIDANNITSDNISVISSLTVSGTNILSSITDILSSINKSNSFIGSTSSSLNITGTTNINFNVNNTIFTKINQSGLSVFHEANGTTFPYAPTDWYNVSDRLDKLYQCMSDTPTPIINYDATHNTIIRISEQDTVNQIYYPRQLQIQSFQGTTFSKFDIQGLQLLDINNNWYYINKMFTLTNNSILLCSNNIKVDSAGQLNVQNVVTNYVLGIPTGTTGTWFSVKDGIMNSISGVSSLTTKTDNILADLTTISGNASNIANVANYYSGLQSSLAVTNGVVSTAGIILAFDLKQDRFDVKSPLSLRDPIAPASTSHEYFKQLELKYNDNLSIINNKLSINTTGFLCPYYGDLSLAPTPPDKPSTSTNYVVVTQLTQPVTCCSSLNISGNTTMLNNATCMSSLNVNGPLTCNIINALNSTVPSILLTTSQTIFNTPSSSTAQSVILTTGGTILNNEITATNTLNVVGNIYANNIANQTPFTVIVTTPCVIGSKVYYKYDIDLTKYTTYIVPGPYTQTRKFKFMCSLSSGAHLAGMYSLNYDIDYSEINYNPVGLQGNLAQYNGINAIAFGFPYPNINMNQITPNGLFIWKNTFNYITIYSLVQINLQCIIIDYLS